MLSLTIDDKKQILTKFEVDREKRDVRLRTSGFFASKTVGLDLDPLQAMDNYGMRDEQEKCFQLQKGRSDRIALAAGRSPPSMAGCSYAS